MFTIADIEKIAELASLELTEAEKRLFAGQFEAILDYFKLIDEVALPDTIADAAEHGGQALREDVAIKSEVALESFSPHLENGHFKVPRVIE